MELSILSSAIQDHLINKFFKAESITNIIITSISPVFTPKMSDILNKNIYYFHTQKNYL